MLRQAEKLATVSAHRLGVVDTLADNPSELIEAAIERVRDLVGRVAPPSDAPTRLPPFDPLDPWRRAASP